MNSIILILSYFTFVCNIIRAAPPFGQLSVKGNKLVGSKGQPVQLVGMSLFWSNWEPGYTFFNAATVNKLKCSWNSNVVRATMGVEEGGNGYLNNPNGERAKVEIIIKAAIAENIYVIVDWHDHNAHTHLKQAIEFFTYIAKTYGAKYTNILYETFNEPKQIEWNTVKSYHQQVVAAIRKYDKKNAIILGTTFWSQDVDIASRNKVPGTNLCYTLHFYAASHKQELRNKAQIALNNGACIFVTEYGTVEASGNGNIDNSSTTDWFNFLDKNKISYLNWSVSNKAESASVLTPGSNANHVGDNNHLTASGRIIKNKLRSMKNGLYMYLIFIHF
ncbi:hypothetical protein ACQ4LE_006961 [Meloidogyne hapla]|uniref:Cellulase domain-containing protein n=1 Tax=Meloidogyne hapla TaxID=6305 RepID=A0A1I8BP55_MELHA